MQTKDIPLHDIKPLIEIQEYSLYYFLVVVVIGLVVVLGVAYLAFNYIKNRNKFNIRAQHFKLLKELNLNNTKKAAYEITHYGATFISDNEQIKRSYENLVEDLERYKYKKDVEHFDEEIKQKIENYIGMIDV